MKIGDMVLIKFGASKWMKERDYWLECYPDSIDGMIGKIVFDYTHLQYDDSHFGVDLGLEYIVGVNPMWLEYAQV